MRQFDIQPDRLGADIEGAAVRGLHQAGTAAGHDYQARRLRAAMRPADQAPEFPRDVIIMALGQNPFGGRQTKIELFVVRMSANRGAQHFDLVARRARLGNARAAVNDDRMVDMLLRQDDVGLEIFDFQPRSANVGTRDEFGILLGEPIGRAFADGAERLRRRRILFGRLWRMLGQRLSPRLRMRR